MAGWVQRSEVEDGASDRNGDIRVRYLCDQHGQDGLQEGRAEGGASLPGSSEGLGTGVTGSQGWERAREAGWTGTAGPKVKSQVDEGWQVGHGQGHSQNVGIPTRHTCMHNRCVCQNEGRDHHPQGQDMRAWLGPGEGGSVKYGGQSRRGRSRVWRASLPGLRLPVPSASVCLGTPLPTCWYWRSASSSLAMRARSSASGWYVGGTW